MTLRREEKIFLHLQGDNTYEIKDRNGNTLVGADEKFFIYFKNVNFKEGGIIEGRYLGEAKDTLIDAMCKTVRFKDNAFKVEGKVVRTARMVIVDNKKKTLIIID